MKIKNALYRFLWRFGKGIYQKLMRLYMLLRDYQGREHMVRYGDDNSDKTIYVIRQKRGSGEGLLSIFTWIMGRIDYADRNGYVPFVDVDCGEGCSLFGRYFRQKSELTREEVYRSRNVILSGWDSKPVYPGWCNWINLDYNEQKNALFEKYISFSDEVMDAVEHELSNIDPQKCLGLYLRGTDYTKLKPFGHPIQPALEDVKQHIDRIMKSQSLHHIYLVTEDKSIYEKVSEAYPGQVLTVKEDRFWQEQDRGELIGQIIERNGNIEDNNILYLVKIILLSRCSAFVGGRTNGSVAANAFNGGKYAERFVFDVGLYS